MYIYIYIYIYICYKFIRSNFIKYYILVSIPVLVNKFYYILEIYYALKATYINDFFEGKLSSQNLCIYVMNSKLTYLLV